MKKLSILAIIFVLILSSCSQRPRPFLSERQMVELLTEVHLIEATLQQKQNQGECFDSMRLFTSAAYAELFNRFGVTRESFEANLLYRTYRSRDLERIYTRVRDNLQRKAEESRQNEHSTLEQVLEATL